MTEQTVVPEQSEPVPHPGEAEHRGHRVVVGVDESEGARAALLFALQDAARRGVPVEAVSAYRPPEYWLDFNAVGEWSQDSMQRSAEDRARHLVDEVLARGPQPPPELHVKAVMGLPVDVLLHESQGADLLVVGSRGRGEFASMLLGSTSIECVMHAPCPVTVVHSPEARRHRLHLHRERRARRPVGAHIQAG
ncbi:universal stress protein [Geodermatophilus sp. YIM 151500]|uniref:universal stress protein n=1 Tax=Geodermatophilus sp. YIM 151500 TaxID=2984531 RepID=UPI0021E45461|nr:universal stress protein [Geodermatophilus sp. YIM 151500]MCV2489914.1 universal stress protein [Geodermatophilus sp. YIM 151500]